MTDPTYQPIEWWNSGDAYHVFMEGKRGPERVGIVNERVVFQDDQEQTLWFAHNKHFFSVGKSFPTREAATAVLNTKSIHHNSDAFK